MQRTMPSSVGLIALHDRLGYCEVNVVGGVEVSREVVPFHIMTKSYDYVNARDGFYTCLRIHTKYKQMEV